MHKKHDLKNGVIHSFPGIGIFTKETIKAYQEKGWLNKMHTTIVFHKESFLMKMIHYIFPKIINKFDNRSFSEIPNNKIRIYPLKELLRLFSVSYLSLVSADKIWEWAELSFDKWTADQLSDKVKLVHAYEHAALSTFQKAEKLGILKILEQTSQHFSNFEMLIKNQFEKYPELKSKYNERISGKRFHERNERKTQEYQLADIIICNSSFTKKTLISGNVDESKIIVVPLAFPVVVEELSPKKNIKKFVFLYAGSLSLNKGSHILLKAWKSTFSNKEDAKLVMIGNNFLPDRFTNDLPKNIEILDFLPQSKLNIYYDEANVFVFPTLADGFGMVITESMARGLPVIASRNSAGPDLIVHKKMDLLLNLMILTT